MVGVAPEPHLDIGANPDNCLADSAPAGRRGAGAVHSLRADCRRGRPWAAGQDIVAALGPDSDFDPAPHCRAGGPVHSGHRAVVQPDPSRLVGQAEASPSAGRFVAPTHPRPEPALTSPPALRKASIANDFYSSTPLLTPQAPGESPDPSAGTTAIDGDTHSPSLVITLFENKSYPESWALHYFLTAVTATFGLVRSLQGPPFPWYPCLHACHHGETTSSERDCSYHHPI